MKGKLYACSDTHLSSSRSAAPCSCAYFKEKSLRTPNSNHTRKFTVHENFTIKLRIPETGTTSPSLNIILTLRAPQAEVAVLWYLSLFLLYWAASAKP